MFTVLVHITVATSLATKYTSKPTVRYVWYRVSLSSSILCSYLRWISCPNRANSVLIYCARVHSQGRTQGGGGGPWCPDSPPPPPRPLPLLYHVRRVHLTSLLHRMHMATKRTSSILSFFSKRSKGKFCSVI